MNQLTLGSTTVPNSGLNQGQRDAADAFFQFLFSPEKEMGISGPGGTGKTHLMGHMIDAILPQYFDTCKIMGIEPQYEEVFMTATTNKAAEQLSHSTKRPCSTIQSAMNLKVADNYETGVTKLTRTRNWTIHEKKIFFIDECSMIDSALYGHIQAATKDCKIVYVGDHCQLAPVMETLSPVYRQGITFYELTEPMRTNVPELQALNNQLRHTVETGEFLPIQIVPGIIDHFDDAQMEAEVNSRFLNQNHGARILAYSNKRVIEYNDHVRWLRQLPPHYTVGENLVNSSAVHLKGAMLNTEQEVEIISLGKSFKKTYAGVEMEFVEARLQTPYGGIYEKVPLPVDRDHFLAMLKYFKNQKNWPAFFDLKNYYPDLRPQDASTVYKAQGSTYDTVFIDLTNISTCHNPSQAARMLYVAVSRPRTRIVFYGELAPKYGGLIH